MTTIADGLKDVFLAGVGAMALGAEKTQELVEQLIAKGEITVEQGKAINSEVLKQAQAKGEQVSQQAHETAGEAQRQARAAASQVEERAKPAASLAKEDAEAAVSWGRSQAEMAADAAKQAAGTAQQDAADFATALRHDVLEAQMAVMTPEERAAFAKKAAEIAARREVRFVMIAGPSSSGKTTFSPIHPTKKEPAKSGFLHRGRRFQRLPERRGRVSQSERLGRTVGPSGCPSGAAYQVPLCRCLPSR